VLNKFSLPAIAYSYSLQSVSWLPLFHYQFGLSLHTDPGKSSNLNSNFPGLESCGKLTKWLQHFWPMYTKTWSGRARLFQHSP